MKSLNIAKIIFRAQRKNLLNLYSKKPIVQIPLAGMTLDKDDVEIARKWLRNSSAWQDLNIVNEYEVEFARWNRSKYAFAFMAGRYALSACIYALGLKPGDEVILPGYTCVVAPNAFQFENVKTVFCDIELETFGLDVASVEKKITPKTRVIFIQHLYGLVSRDYEALLNLAKRHNIWVIEDCAHATGAEYKGIKVGNRGHVAFYSSEESKVFNTIQGGVAVTNDSKIAERLSEYYQKALLPENDHIDKQLHRVFISYYSSKHPSRWWRRDVLEYLYQDKRLISTTPEEERGIRPKYYGSKMVAPIAALGLNQLAKIDDYIKKRRRTVERWIEYCDTSSYKKPLVIADSKPVYLRYPVLVETEKKKNTSWAEEKWGIELGVWFVTHIHPVNRAVEGCPNADQAVARCINFPSLME